MTPLDQGGAADCLILAVRHREYEQMGLKRIAELIVQGGILLDIKGQFDKKEAQELGLTYWRL